jgi:hypothetical protein
MTIEVHEGVAPDTQPKKWVLAGDGVIGEVICTKKQALELAAGPNLLAALKQCREALLHICRNPAFENDAPEFNEGGIGYEACSVAIVAIQKAERQS